MKKIGKYGFLVASVCFYLCAAFAFFSKTGNKSMAVTWLSLGSCFLCLYATSIQKKD